MNNQLYLANQVVAMEANNPRILGLELFGRVGPALAEGFKHSVSAVNGFFTANMPCAFDNSAKKAVSALDSMDYASIMDIPMPVPEGFKGNLISYGVLLTGISDKLRTVGTGLNDVVRNLSIIATNPSMSIDSKSMAPSIKDLISEMEVKEPLFAEFLDPNKANHTLPFGTLIPRNKEWNTVVKTAEELHLSSAKLDRKATLASVKEIERLLDKVIYMYHAGKYVDLPSDWLSDLSSTIYNIARLLEWYSVVYYRVLAYLQAVEDTGKKLTELSKEGAH